MDDYDPFDTNLDVLPVFLPDYDEDYDLNINDYDNSGCADFETPLVEKETVRSLRLVLNKGIGE